MASETRRRPRDRRDQLIRSAAHLFRRSGYHQVGITDLAAAEGITSGALYRHFANKDAMLRATIEMAVARIESAIADSTDTEVIVTRLIRSAIAHPDDSVLWAREVRHLRPEAQAELRQRLSRSIDPLRAAIRDEHPGVSRADAEMRCWAILGALRITDNRTIVWTDPVARDELAATLRRIVSAPPQPLSERPARPRAAGLQPASRSDAILVAALRLFTDVGYAEVTIDDIGAAVGITGATVYHHFPSKTAILIAGLHRAVEYVFFDFAGILVNSDDPAEALDAALRSYTRIGLEWGPVLGSLLAEAPALDDDTRRHLRSRSNDYAGEWVALAAAAEPDVPTAALAVRVSATLMMSNALSAVPRLTESDGAAPAILALGRAVLRPS